jgi:uncharacterized membrane protein YedE/YeeE
VLVETFKSKSLPSRHYPAQPFRLDFELTFVLGFFSVESPVADLFNWASLGTPRGFLLMVLGGFMVGFGTRYAGGCTSGHAISGLSDLQMPSLIAVIGFFIGGLVMTFLIFPFIFS